MTVAASEDYNTAFEIELTARLAAAGYTASFTARPDTARNAEPVREITGVPVRMIAFFSRRRAATEARYAAAHPRVPGRARPRPAPPRVPQARPAGQPGNPRGQGPGPLAGTDARRLAGRN